MRNKKTSLCLLAIACFVAQCFLIPHLNAQEPKIKVDVQPKKADPSPVKAAPGGKQPAIAFDVIQFDAGEVWEGDTVSHAFIVKNTGKAELTISNVKPG
jgi:hypothetical protein